MTVVERGRSVGRLLNVISEGDLRSDTPDISFAEEVGGINPNLTVGVDVTSVSALLSNAGLAHDGVKLHGKGFRLDRAQATALGYSQGAGNEVIKPYVNGRDLNQRSRGVFVVDLFGLDEAEVRQRFPQIYSFLLQTVKPLRQQNNRSSYRDAWWIFGEPRRELRPALKDIARYIATVDTSKHRMFQFLATETVCDDKVVIIASDDPFQWASSHRGSTSLGR
jgi:hypothetical protein